MEQVYIAQPGAGYYNVIVTHEGTLSGTQDYALVLSGFTVPPPVADFTASHLSGVVPYTVIFTDLSTGDPDTRLWDFGDGGTSDERNPTHMYTAPGIYTVTLTVTNDGGSDSLVRPAYIEVHGPPGAGFMVDTTLGCAPFTAAFTDTSTGEVDQWAWDFGDGGTASYQHPTHDYAAPGLYDVTLTVTGPWGSDALTRTELIRVEEPVTAAASVSAIEGTAPLTADFSDLSTGGPTSWHWEFGDGAVDTLQHPSHTYVDAGTYTVTLTAGNSCGDDTVVLVDHITVSPPPFGVLAHWTFDEAAGDTLHDISGNQNHGFIDGAEWQDGVSGTALSFSRLSDRVVVPDSPTLDLDLGPFTIEAIVKRRGASLDPSNPVMTIVSKYGSGNTGLLFDITGDEHPTAPGRAYVNMNGSSGTNFLGVGYVDTLWHHIAVSRGTDGQARIYIDGLIDAEMPLVGDMDITIGVDLMIGHDNREDVGQANWTFHGLIDEIRISDAALVPGQFLPLPPPPAWIDVTSGPLADAGDGIGVAWADYDDDGLLDLYVTNTSGSDSRLLRNEGGGAFTDQTAGDLVYVGHSHGTAWADYDNDGDPDLFVANSGGANKLFRNDGGGVFVDATTGTLGDDGPTRCFAWADYDRDGLVDLYVVNRDVANRLLRNEGDGTFADVTTSPLDDAGTGQGVAWGDYDGDGDPDLYVSNQDSENKLLRNDGGGAFVDVTSGPLSESGPSTGVAWGDYDGDGDLDLYMALAQQPNKLLRNDGGGAFTDVSAGVLADPGLGLGVVWLDSDNDGDLDLYLANYDTPNRLLLNEGGGAFVDATGSPLGDMSYNHGAACGDMDRDGDLDLYMASGLANRMFRNDSAGGNHWLHLDLEGLVSNRSAIGARARVVVGTTSQIREVSGGSGYCSQNSLELAFGLGSATVADSVEITWPSGVVQVLTQVPADTLVHILETDDLTPVELPSSSAVVLHPCVPNPFNPRTTIAFDLPRETTVSLHVYDVSGRLVDVLLDRAAAREGRTVVDWQGCDLMGRRVPAGVYFCRLLAGGRGFTKRMVLVK